MIVDYVELTSDDDEVVIGEEHSVHVNGYSVDVKKEIIDLTCEDDISEEEHVAHGQGDAAQDTAFLKQEFIADDGQAEPAQCAAALERQEYREGDWEGDAANCAVVQGKKLTIDDGQGDTTQCATTMLRQLSADDGHVDVAQHTTTLQREELTSDDGHDATAECTTPLQRQELNAYDRQDTGAHTMLQRQESDLDYGQHDVTETEGQFPRQFWKAGEYRLAAQAAINSGQNRLRIHPKFLHSNATSHKWAFGAIAELLDNAIDEVANGATFVKIDKMKHSHDGDYSLVVQDNGGGMSPETLRYCMSFGFSQKCTSSSIGQYGNGFKTSTMRLGADVIVFSCTQDNINRRLTRSVGLLSYTFLTRTKCNDIFVPAVDYEFDALSSTFKRIMNRGEKHFLSNLSTLLKWSPYSTEDELLNQFSNMECHGTKIIVFNLWFNDASEMELDFVTNNEDILISGAPDVRARHNTIETQMHVAIRFRYSLRVYASILYLHVPKNFQIILCGRAVEPHCIVQDLIYRECIQYRPHTGVSTEVDVFTTIGFLKGAPRLDIYGFNVYHKNRLILPFWPAGSWTGKRRGIAGVLEADFIRPTHDKQDFERTGLFQRLETRLKDMATEYWNHHCHFVGYITGRHLPPHHMPTAADNDDDNLTAQATTNTADCNSRSRATEAFHSFSNGYHRRDPLHVGALMDRMDYGACPSTSINVGTRLNKKRNAPQQSQTELCKGRNSRPIYWRAQKRRNTNVYSDQPGSNNGTEMQEEIRPLIHQNTMLNAECSELEAAGEQLRSKADKLQRELNAWRQVQQKLTDELQFYDGLDMLRRRRQHDNFPVGFI